MYSTFALKLIFCEYRLLRSLLLSPGRRVLSITPKIDPFVRSAATIAPQVLRAQSGKVSQIGLAIRKCFREYLLNQLEYKSLVLNANNLNFKTEGRPASVQLLRNLITAPEDEKPLEKLSTILLKEKEILDVEEICKTFFLTFKYKNASGSAQQVADLLEKELRSRELSKPEALKALFCLHSTWGREKNFFLRKIIVKNCHCIHKLSVQEAVILFYCMINLSTETIKDVKFKVNQYFINNILSLNAVELGIIAKGLLKGGFSCKGELKINFMKRVTEVIDHITPEPLTQICKLLETNFLFDDGNMLMDFQEKLIPYVSKHKFTLPAVATIGTKFGHLNLSFWENAVKVFKENINDYCLLGTERMVSVLTECDVRDDELVNLAIKKFESQIDNLPEKNKKHLILFLNYLVHLRVYPKKLFDAAYAKGPAFIKVSGRQNVVETKSQIKYWETKCLLELDKPEFEYNFSERERLKLSRIYTFASPFSSKSSWRIEKVLTHMHETLESIYGNNIKSYWRPMHRLGSFMMFDKNLKTKPVPECYDGASCLPKNVSKDDHTWVHIWLLLPGKTIGRTGKLKLHCQTYIRHLEALGYNPIVVKLHEYQDQIAANTTVKFLQNLLSNTLGKST